MAHIDISSGVRSAVKSFNGWFRSIGTTSDRSWLWGWAWGADNVLTVVDRSPPINFVSRPASFGRLIEDSVMGYGIPMNAFTVSCNDQDRNDSIKNLGCPNLCLIDGGHMPEPEDSWIAIIQRGNCSFVEKVREAQRFGAKAVIVGGDNPDVSGNPDVLINMYSQTDSSDIKIPSTYIKYTDYSHLSNLIAVSNTSTSGIKTVSLQITPDYASWEWYSPILTFIVLLFLPSLLTLITLLIHRFRAARAEQRERAPEDVVQRLPWRVWTGNGWEKHTGPVPPTPTKVGDEPFEESAMLERGCVKCSEENSRDESHETANHPSTSHEDDEVSINPPWFDAQTECAICLNDFAKGDRVRVLPCKHIFHLAEVDEWLIHRKKLCPVCKADVTQPDNPYHHLVNETHNAPTERTPLLSHTQTTNQGGPDHTISTSTTPPSPRSTSHLLIGSLDHATES